MRKFLLTTTTALCLASLPLPAYSAPLAAIIGGALGGLGTIGTALLGTALSIGANWLIQKIFAEEPKAQGVKQRMDSGGDNPISFIVGKYATPGKLAYVNSYGEDAKGLIMVVNLSEIPVTALSSKMIINGRVCDIDFDDLDDDGFAKVEQYQEDGRNYCSVKFFNDPSSAPNFLTSTFGSDPIKPWENDMIGKGCSYVVVYCRFSTDGIWSGIPTFKFVVKGIPLYDPRKDSSVGGSGSHRWNNRSTYEYSENCYVISYNIVRGIRYGGNKVFGGNANAEQLPLDIWTAAMNTCDETINLKNGGSIKRYTMGAEISVDIAPLDILREIDNSASGYTFEFGGIWKAFCGNPGASVVNITDEDILSSSEQVDDLFKPLQETYNVAQSSYPEPEACWEPKDAPTRYFTEYIDEDGEELSINMEFPYVFEGNQVQRLMRAAVKDNRRQRVHEIVLPPPFAKFEPYDVITWNSVRNGYEDKKFLIISKEDTPNCTQRMVVREINPDDYDWTTIMELDSTVGPLIDDPVSTSRDFTVEADFIDRPSAGKDKPAIKVTWDWGEHDLNIRTIRWRIRRNGKTKVIARGDFDNYQDGEETFTNRVLRFGQSYDIQFRIEPRGKKKSEWGDWKPITMLPIDVPTGLTLTAHSKLNGDGKLRFWVKANWDEVSQEHNGYGVKIETTGDADPDFRRTDGSKYRFEVDAPTTVTVSVRTRSGDGGTAGTYCTPVVLPVTKKTVAPTSPTGFTAVGRHRRVILKVDDHPDADFKRWNVYFNKTNDFTTGTKSKHSNGNRLVIDDLDNGEDYYFWITAEDTSGNESNKFPASNTDGRHAKTDKIDDHDTEDGVLDAPTALTLTKLQDIDEDGTVRTFIEMNCTAPPWATPKTHYAYSITVSGKEYRRRSDDTLARFEVLKTGVDHVVKVRGIKGHGNRGEWSGTSLINPGKKTGLPTTGSGLSTLNKPLGIRLRWVKCTDKDYKETIVYRNTVNTFATAVELDRVKGTSYKDDDALVAGTTYYYWIAHVDKTDNVGLPSSSANAAWKKIDDDDTDETVLAAPTALTLTKVQDKDEDGTIRTYILMSCTAPPWANSKTTYEYEVTVDGVDEIVPSGDTTKRYRVNKTGVAHSVRVRGVKGVGNKGSWTAASPITPTKKNADASAVTGVSSHKKNGDIVVKWNPIADRDNAEYIIRRATSNSYGASSEIGRVKGTRFVDKDVNTKNVTYYYFIDPVDTTGNVGSASASTSQVETGIGTSDTDAAVLAAPTGISLFQSNRDVDQDGTVDIALRTTFSGGVANAAGYEVWWEDNAGQSASVRADSGSFWFMANSTKTYRVRWRTINWVGAPGSWSSYTSYVAPNPVTGAPAAPFAFVAFDANGRIGFSWNAPSELDYDYSELAINGTTDASVRHTTTARFGEFTNSLTGSLTIYARHVNTSGVKSSWSSYSVSAIAPIKMATSLLGTSAGSVNAGVGDITFLSVTFVASSTESGITINLGSRTWSGVDFVNDQSQTFTYTEVGGGSFSFSKSGGGSFRGVTLSAITVDQ